VIGCPRCEHVNHRLGTQFTKHRGNGPKRNGKRAKMARGVGS
jgi:hypothetical protein